MRYKYVVHNGDGFTFALEPYPDRWYVHCDVTDNKPSVLKNMLSRWKEFRKLINIDLYALHSDIENIPTHRKFLKMFGFKLLEEAQDDSSYEVWINEGTIYKKWDQ